MNSSEPNSNETLEAGLRQLCEMARKRNEATGAPRSSSEFGQALAKRLSRLAARLASALALDDQRRPRLRITYSRGATTLPRVFWIGIVPEGKSVGNSMSVTLCFGKRGEGVVAGLMNCAFVPSKLSCVKRSKDDIHVDVDGPKPETRYNNRFFNPREFLTESFNDQDMLAHLRESIELLKRELAA